MARIEIGKHLAADSRICGGRLIFKGTRILVSDALELTASGYTPSPISRHHHRERGARSVNVYTKRHCQRNYGTNQNRRVIVLDHNIPEDEAEKLRRRRVHFRQIGFEVGRPEWDDQQEILRFLHKTKQIIFFTRDMGFFRAPLRHGNYCLVALTVPVLETAHYISKLLRHPHFNTRAKTQGESHKSFNTENKLLGDRTAATDRIRLVSSVWIWIFDCRSKNRKFAPKKLLSTRLPT